MPAHLRRVRARSAAKLETPLPRHAGRRVHHRARQALDAADPRRQAHRAGGGAHRRRHGRARGCITRAAGGAARLARPGRLLPAPAVRRAARSAAAKARGDLLATGLNVSPGAASGRHRLRRRHRRALGAEGEASAVIMVRPETKPDDVHGMLAAQGHPHQPRRAHQPRGAGGAAVRQARRGRRRGARDRPRGAQLHDRRAAVLARGRLASRSTARPARSSSASWRPWCPTSTTRTCSKLLAWADGFRRLGVWANADYPRDAERARGYGAEGIGLCRTEHMFFETERLPIVQRMILATDDGGARRARSRSCCRSSARTSSACSGPWTACR